MRVTKWLLSCSLAIVLALGVAACGGDDEEPAGGGGSNTGQEAAAEDCGTMSLLVVDDDSHRSGLWAIENGEVTSDSVELEITYGQIPALIQATGSGQYDITQTSLPGVALARQGGAELEIVYFGIAHTGGGIQTFVAKDSDIQDPSDLKGKTLGVVSLGSTATLEAASVYNGKYNIDAKPEGGDIRWTELDPPTLLNAVKKGQVDAALMWHSWGWQAENDPQLRAIDDLDDEFREINGEWPIGSAYTATSEQLEGKEDCYREFQRMINESRDYAQENISDIAPEVSEASGGVPPEFIEFWWDGAYEFGGLDQEWLDRAEVVYDVAVQSKVIEEKPNLDEIVLQPQG